MPTRLEDVKPEEASWKRKLPFPVPISRTEVVGRLRGMREEVVR
jgi:hypothetical protein